MELVSRTQLSHSAAALYSISLFVSVSVLSSCSVHFDNSMGPAEVSRLRSIRLLDSSVKSVDTDLIMFQRSYFECAVELLHWNTLN